MGQDSLRITRAAAVSHNVGTLAWNAVPCHHYTLHRQFPDQTQFHLIASLPAGDTVFLDTLHRVICADSVNYYVSAHTSDSLILCSDTVGLYYRDDVPTAPCSLRLCTVDTVSGQILLSWYPSPDTDVMGYYIVYGTPSRGLDTVWGRLNTSYLCPTDLTGPIVQSQYDFRILAFDSCYQASPLTPYYHNPLLQFTDPGCTRRFHCQWNEYINMPDGVGEYRLHYRLPGQSQDHIFSVSDVGNLTFDTVVANLSDSTVQIFLEVRNATDSLSAFSPIYTFVFPPILLPDRLEITHATFVETEPAVHLTLDIDAQYAGFEVLLFRRKSAQRELQLLARLPYSFGMSQLSYIDHDVHRAEPYYVYQAVAADPCGLAETRSDTFRVDLPEVQDPGIFYPNVIIYGHPEAGLFCPRYTSVLESDYQLFIYNRFGCLVFHTTSLSDSWDGTSADGTPLPQGTYVFVAYCRHADGSSKKYHGTVTLVR